MLVAGRPKPRVAPSEHFRISLDAVSASFRRLVEDLVDGRPARPDGVRLDVSARTELPTHLRLVAAEYLPGSDRCFLIDVFARTDGGLDGPWDDRGTPTLPDDVLTGGRWQLYNCLVAVQVWGRAQHLAGKYPKDWLA